MKFTNGLTEAETKARNRRIFELREGGMSFKEIERMFGLTQQSVNGIYHRERRRDEWRKNNC